jgi:hypothetical protein
MQGRLPISNDLRKYTFAPNSHLHPYQLHLQLYFLLIKTILTFFNRNIFKIVFRIEIIFSGIRTYAFCVSIISRGSFVPVDIVVSSDRSKG